VTPRRANGAGRREHSASGWPATAEELVKVQAELGAARPDPWRPEDPVRSVAGCFVCFARGRSGRGRPGDPGWAAAVWLVDSRLAAIATVRGEAAAAYEPGLLALREGPILEAAVRSLRGSPEVLIVNATGRDHPRQAGLAVHLGARLALPTIGITRRTLLAAGERPADRRGATSPLRLGGEVVGYWLCTRPRTAPLAIHAGWRTDPETALAVVTGLIGRWQTPEPLRLARRAAREARDRGL